MDVVQRPDRLQLDYHGVVHQQIDGVFADYHAVVPNGDATLLLNRESCLTQLMRQCILVHFLDEPRSERIGNRDGTANDPFRQTAELHLIRVHPCESVVSSSFVI